MKLPRYFNGVFLLAGLLLAGCGSTPTKTTQTVGPVNNPLNSAIPVGDDFTNDADGSRLQDIEGALIHYYAINKDLPPTLEDARSYGDIDTPLNFTSPDSGLPYSYVPHGLHRSGKDMYIVVNDPVPHDGARHCIIMSISGSNRTPQPQVVVMPEAMFLSYH